MAKHFSLSLLLSYIDQATGRSMQDEKTCSYRGLNGRKCFVGVYIPDRQYNEGLEGSLPNLETMLTWIKPNRDFLDDLQEIHDESCPLDWSERKDELKARVIACFKNHKKRIDT